MDFRSIIHRELKPKKITGLGKIPWDDPEISQRMLLEHLSQYNDAASRRRSIIKKHVQFIHTEILAKKPSHILDLGCGPGLYSICLAKLGHTCVGIDFAPAAINYAQESARSEHVFCTFKLEDFTRAEYGNDYDLVMMVFSELNTLAPGEIREILARSFRSLVIGGKLLLEVPSFDAVYQIGNQPPIWYSEERGVFSAESYLCLTESFWDESSSTAVERYYVIPESGGPVGEFINRTRAFEENVYQEMMLDAGFSRVSFFPSLAGEKQQQLDGMEVVLAVKD